VPLLKRCNLPIRFDWLGLAYMYWLLLAERSIFAAVILYLIGIRPSGARSLTLGWIWRERLRTLLVLAYFSGLWWALGWAQGLLLTVDTVAILEFRERLKPQTLRRTAGAVLVPASYFFCGLLLVSAYNDIILSVRFFALADPALNSMDQWLLRGLTVSRICHWALRVFPLSFFQFLEFIYFGLFSQIGAGLILAVVFYGRRRGVQFVGTVLTAYYLALAMFYLWPSQGPYYLCTRHFSELPSILKTYAAQKGSIAGAQARWNREPLGRISFDYYIALPCMHIVQPLIVMWFLRAWKRVTVFLAAYNTLLLAAIVLLEWHYIVDILAGLIVAVVAIVAMDGDALWHSSNSTGCGASPMPEPRPNT